MARRNMGRASPQDNGSRIHVGQLAYDVSSEDLYRAFFRFGSISDADVIVDRSTGMSRGFGFVTFDRKEDADAAIRGMDGETLRGRRVRVSLAHGSVKRRSIDQANLSSKKQRATPAPAPSQSHAEEVQQYAQSPPAETSALPPVKAMVVIRASKDAHDAKVLLPAATFPRRGEDPEPVITADALVAAVRSRVSNTRYQIKQSVLVLAEDPRVGGTPMDSPTKPLLALKPQNEWAEIANQASIPADHRGEAGRTNPCYVLVTGMSTQQSPAISESKHESFTRGSHHQSVTGLFAATQTKLDEGHTAWLQALACAERIVCKFSDHLMLDVLPVDDHIPDNVPGLIPFHDQITRDIVVRPFFDRLLELLLTPEVLTPGLYVLVGNPGIGKSWFQGYILWALLKAAQGRKKNAKFGYKLVLRQLGDNQLYLYSINAQHNEIKAWRSTGTRHQIEDIVRQFQGNRSVLYLYDPEQDGSRVAQFNIHTIATVSPNKQRVKYVLHKGRGVRRFMPAWTRFELLAAGRYVATKLRGPSTTEIQSLFEEDKILERIEQFGGIPRLVLPAQVTKLIQFQNDQAMAFEGVSFSILTRVDQDIGTDHTGGNISHFLLHYSTLDFIHFVFRYPSRYVELRIREQATRLSFIQAVQAVREVVYRRIPERGGPLLEVVTLGMIERKVSNWEVRFLPLTEILRSQPPPKQVRGRELAFEEQEERAACMQAIQGKVLQEVKAAGFGLQPLFDEMQYVHHTDIPPRWETMKQRTLYSPANTTFPLVAAVGVVGSRLEGVQCKAGDVKQFEPLACVALRSDLGLAGEVAIHIWIVTLEQHVKDWYNLLASPWATPKGKTTASIAAQRAAIANVTFAVVTHSFYLNEMISGGIDMDISGQVVGRPKSAIELGDLKRQTLREVAPFANREEFGQTKSLPELFRVVENDGGGDSLFHAVGQAIGKTHEEVRADVVGYLQEHREKLLYRAEMCRDADVGQWTAKNNPPQNPEKHQDVDHR